MIKCILWDNDGVLVDTERLFYQANAEILNLVGFQLGVEAFRDNFLRTSCGVWHVVQGIYGLSDIDVLGLREKRDRRYHELISSYDIEIPGIEDIVANLSKRYRMGVVTSSDKESFNKIHSKTNLLRYFNFIVTHEQYSNSKPDPEPYLRGIELSECQVSECLAIEDSERGLVSAKSAGIQCWVIYTKLNEGSDFSKADRILSDPSALLSALNQSLNQ